MNVGLAVALVPVAIGDVGTIGEPIAAGPVTAPVVPTVPVAKPVDEGDEPVELTLAVLVQEHSVS